MSEGDQQKNPPPHPTSRRFDSEKLRMGYRRVQHRLHLLKHWWLRTHVPYQPFFTIATARSGSNLLIDFINNLPGVQTLWEVLCNSVPEGPHRARIRPAKAIKHIRYSLQTLSAPRRGCKLMLHQLARCALTIDDLENVFPGAKYIVLYRQSLAEQYVSLQAAMTTNQWAVFDGRTGQSTLVRIDPAELRSYCDRIRQGYRELLTHPAIAERAVLLSYEELTKDPATCLRDCICPHLEVPSSAPTSTLRKQHPQPLAERVANYKAVAELVNSTLCQQSYTLQNHQLSSRRAA